MSIQWDAGKLGVSPAEARKQLSDGDPRIEISGGEDGLTINPYMMEEGEETIVARRLTEVLAA
jgi:L-seryl-tRNA(Ser) seleniumtransferase